MSIYLSFDGGDPEDFASNRGWGDFARWADSLDAAAYGNVAHLADYGWCQRVPELRAELGRALAATPPAQASVAATARALAAALAGRDAEVVAATGGLSPGGGR